MSQDGPLTEDELELMDEQLLQYSSEAGILGLSELDGFLTALASGPAVVPASIWLSALWGNEGDGAPWPGETPLHDLMALLFRHLNDIVDRLTSGGDALRPIFQQAEDEEGEYLVVEDWCYGYLRGVELGDWPPLPPEQQAHLEALSLFGSEQGQMLAEGMTEEHYHLAVEDIAPAAIALYQYFNGTRLAGRPRSAGVASPAAAADPGTTDLDRPCPCGSGKPFRKCCLH